MRKPKDILRPKDFTALMKSDPDCTIYVFASKDGFRIIARDKSDKSWTLGMSKGPTPRTFKRLETAKKWLETRGRTRCAENAARLPDAVIKAEIKKEKEDHDRFMAAPGNKEWKDLMRDADAGMPMIEGDFDDLMRYGEAAEKESLGLLREVQEEASRRTTRRREGAKPLQLCLTPLRSPLLRRDRTDVRPNGRLGRKPFKRVQVAEGVRDLRDDLIARV